MGFLTDNASKQFRKASSRAYVPEWYKPAGTLALVGMGVVLVGSLVLGGGEGGEGSALNVADAAPVVSETTSPSDLGNAVGEIPVEPDTEVVPEPGASSEPSTEPSSAPDEPGTGPQESSVSVPTMTGESATVPESAYITAQAAGLALYSGDFSQVVLADGSSAPSVAADPGAVLTGLSVDTEDDAAILFQVGVKTSDGATHVVSVTTVPSSQGWAYKSNS